MSPDRRQALYRRMATAEHDVMLAIAPVLAAHGAQGTLGAMAVVMGGMVGISHDRRLLSGPVTESLAELDELIRCGLHQHVTQRAPGGVG